MPPDALGERLVMLKIEDIETEGGTQSRAALNPEAVAEYAEALRAGADFPPVVVFHDGSRYWLASGFHRVRAHQQAGRIYINATVRQGTQRDARLFSASTNIQHGLRRTNADKRHAVRLLLDDPEWAQWPDLRIAHHTGVSPSLVGNLRRELAAAAERAAEQELPACKTDVLTDGPPKDLIERVWEECLAEDDAEDAEDALDTDLEGESPEATASTDPDDEGPLEKKIIRSARKFYRQARELARLRRTAWGVQARRYLRLAKRAEEAGRQRAG
jgi:ParB-like chromosome segregation protein Spo0J